MVCEWGMSNLGMIRFSEDSDYVFFGRDMAGKRQYSEATAQLIDAEVKRLIDEAYVRATNILQERKTTVELIAKALLEFETLDGAQVADLIHLGHMKNPPIMEQRPPPIPPAPMASSAEVSKPNLPDFPTGGLVAPVPA
jgi:cell division protease FtsH